MNAQFKLIASGAALLVALIAVILLKPFTIIQTYERGVVLHFGAFEGQVMQPGLNWYNPITKDVVTIDVRTQKFQIDKSQAYSKDLQVVTIESVLNYNLDPMQVGKIYQTIGTDIEGKVIRPSTEASVKEVIAQYTAEQILAQRGKVQDEIQAAIVERMTPVNVVVTQFSMVNEDFSDQFEAAIERKQVAAQDAEAQANVTKQEEQKKKQEILKAEALAEKSRLEAQALNNQASADTLIRLRQAEAQLEMAKHYKGDVPATLIINGEGNNGAVPFLPINIK